MVLVKATVDSEQNQPAAPDPAMMAAMTQYNTALREAGVLIAAEGLKPTSEGFRIHVDGEARTLLPGPFLPPQEQVAGFWLWEVRDMDEALEWARRCPNPMPGPSDIEVRPLHTL